MDSIITGCNGIQPLPEDIVDLDSPRSGFESPVCHRITVAWGDCDPAQIAYTARIPAWVLEAVEQWYRECLGMDWYEINLTRGIGTPFVALDCDFRYPVTPLHSLELTVYISRLGNSSVSHYVQGMQDNQLCFSANTTAVFTRAKVMEPLPIPANIRGSIENYVQNQDKAGAEPWNDTQGR